MLTLISLHLCPYVQRVAIALTEKQIPFERHYIDLANKPGWFQAISPLGKVPLLQQGEAVLFESAVICEYLEEIHPRTPLHPADPLQRAQHRGWIEFASAILGDVWGFETARDEATARAKAAALRRKFQQVDAVLGAGPFFAGAPFCLVDAAFAPVFRYFDLFDRIADFGIFDGLGGVAAWRRQLLQRPSVASAVTSDYHRRLLHFLARHEAYLHVLASQQSDLMGAA